MLKQKENKKQKLRLVNVTHSSVKPSRDVFKGLFCTESNLNVNLKFGMFSSFDCCALGINTKKC